MSHVTLPGMQAGYLGHRPYMSQLLWLIPYKGARYEEPSPAVSAKSRRTRATRMIRELKKLGYRVEGGPVPARTQA